MKHIKTYESFLNEAYKAIPYNVKIAGKYKVLVDIGAINKSITELNPVENKNKNQKFIKFTNELGSSFYIPENSLIIFLENYQLSNFVKN